MSTYICTYTNPTREEGNEDYEDELQQHHQQHRVNRRTHEQVNSEHICEDWLSYILYRIYL